MSWIADRTRYCDSSGIRKVFDLAATMTDPINLSIGQPDFAVPDEIQQAAVDAIHAGRNGYALTQGMPALCEQLSRRVAAQYGHADRQVFVTSGTSGGLVLAMLAAVNPGDEVIALDPYFVMYPALVGMVGGTCVLVDTYPDFRIDLDRVRAAITPRTKMILFNSPANPTGVTATQAEVEGMARLAAEHNLLLVSDEIYSRFSYDGPPLSPATYNERTLVIDGFSKTYGVTGWRLGFAHGPQEIISQMIKLQQYTFVCAAAVSMGRGQGPGGRHATARRRLPPEARLSTGRAGRRLRDRAAGRGVLHLPPRPWGTASEFVARAIENQLLVIPGNIFSRSDTHFRISYAASDRTLERGVEVLKRLAKGKREGLWAGKAEARKN